MSTSNIKPRVFVPHEPCRYDGVGKTLVPIYDLSHAATFGELVPLLDRGPLTLTQREVIDVLWDKLHDFTDDDFILCIGDPVVIASACMVASKLNGDFAKVLRYERSSKEYHPIEINLGE